MNTSGFRGFNDEELKALTGKSWTEWCDLLDAWDGDAKNLSTLAAHLMQQYGLRRLYAQMIAVYYKWEWRSSHYAAL